MAFDLGTLTGLALTFFVYSYILYKETVLFKFAEYTFLGVAIGNTLVVATKTIETGCIGKISGGDVLYVVPLILGLMVFSRLTDQWKDLSRWGIAVLIGAGTGLTLAMGAHTRFRTLSACITPLLSAKSATDYLGAVLLVIGAICVIIYFQFTSYWDRPSLNYVRKVGRIFLMVAFGAQFGAVVLTRLSTLTGRLYFIVHALGLA